MATKKEIEEMYAERTKDHRCPNSVLMQIERFEEDANGIYTDLSLLIVGAKREYLTTEEVVESINKSIRAYISDLSKILAMSEAMLDDLR
jgi:hypothetical protein